MKILIIDGQGGRIGRMLVEGIIDKIGNHELIVIGTNTLATAAMIKAGAQQAATGENPVVFNSKDADIIVGPIGIVMANSMLGEVTEKMAVAISSSKATKILIPISKCNHVVIGMESKPLGSYIESAVSEILKIIA